MELHTVSGTQSGKKNYTEKPGWPPRTPEKLWTGEKWPNSLMPPAYCCPCRCWSSVDMDSIKKKGTGGLEMEKVEGQEETSAGKGLACLVNTGPWIWSLRTYVKTQTNKKLGMVPYTRLGRQRRLSLWISLWLANQPSLLGEFYASRGWRWGGGQTNQNGWYRRTNSQGCPLTSVCTLIQSWGRELGSLIPIYQTWDKSWNIPEISGFLSEK